MTLTIHIYPSKPSQGSTVNAIWLNASLGLQCLRLLMFSIEVAIDAMFLIDACAASVSFAPPIFIRVLFAGSDRFRSGPRNPGQMSMPIGTLASASVMTMAPVLCLTPLPRTRLWRTNASYNCLMICFGLEVV